MECKEIGPGETENKVLSEAGFSVTASHLIEYLYCPRFTFFEYVLGIPQNQQTRFKVTTGRKIHETSRQRNPDYLRKKIGAVKKISDQYLSSPTGIRGVVDEILFLDDGTAAPLDYKYAEYKQKIFRTYKYQLAFYGLLIRENYNTEVDRGFLVYTRSRNKLVQVDISDSVYEKLDKMIKDLIKILQKGYYPNPTKYKSRCGDCCYRNICESSL